MKTPLETFTDALENLKGAAARFFAADAEIEIEVARTGKWKDMLGHVVELTKERLQELAASLDLAKHRPKIKKGHETPKSGEPALGEVTALRVDGETLLATLAMSKDLADDVRNKKFTERSIEFEAPETGPWTFLHCAMLGARDMAIKGMAHLNLAASDVAAGHVVMLSEPAPEPEPEPEPKPKVTPPVDKPVKLNTGHERSREMADPTKEDLEREQKKAKDSADRTRRFAEADVQHFLGSEAAIKRGLPLLKGLPELMRSLAGQAAIEDTPTVVKFAGADKKDVELSPYETLKTVLLSMPEKLAAADTEELTPEQKAAKAKAAGDDPRLPPVNATLLDRNEETDQIHLAAVEFQAGEEKRGHKIPYKDAVVAVTMKN